MVDPFYRGKILPLPEELVHAKPSEGPGSVPSPVHEAAHILK